jgi:hypothetical protein
MALFRRRVGGAGPEGQTGRWGLPFGRREGGRPAEPVVAQVTGAQPVLDPACGDEELALLLAHAKAGDWPALRDGLTAVADQGDRTWMLAVVADTGGIEEWIPKAIEAEPDSALPLLVSGARHVSWAWEARSKARAKYVSQEQWNLFHERLEIAEEQLYQVAEREPDWLGPWYFLQVSGRGEAIDKEAARYRFEAAVRRCPGHLASHRQRLQQLCAKWSGSHEEMHAFARTSMLSAPEGSPLGELVAIAHLEHWLELWDETDAAERYLTSRQVRDELREAADRSVLHPAYGRPRGWKAAYNTFAMALSLADEEPTAHRLFSELGDTVTESPWHYLDGTPESAFRSHRDACARSAR